MATDKIFVGVAGNIGTGKTSLTRLLSDRFNWEPHFEIVEENPYLRDFYKDMGRWAFPQQMYFLNQRFQTHTSIWNGSNSAIQDRTIFEDANIFARNLFESGHMDARDYENYLKFYNTLCEFIEPPDLIIYLRKSLPQLRSYIQRRGREYEREIPDEYLVNLNRYYDDWMEQYEGGKKIIIDSDHLDFVNRPEDFDLIGREVLNALDQQDLFERARNR